MDRWAKTCPDWQPRARAPGHHAGRAGVALSGGACSHWGERCSGRAWPCRRVPGRGAASRLCRTGWSGRRAFRSGTDHGSFEPVHRRQASAGRSLQAARIRHLQNRGAPADLLQGGYGEPPLAGRADARGRVDAGNRWHRQCDRPGHGGRPPGAAGQPYGNAALCRLARWGARRDVRAGGGAGRGARGGCGVVGRRGGALFEFSGQPVVRRAVLGGRYRCRTEQVRRNFDARRPGDCGAGRAGAHRVRAGAVSRLP